MRRESADVKTFQFLSTSPGCYRLFYSGIRLGFIYLYKRIFM